jgi:hypothetical protein
MVAAGIKVRPRAITTTMFMRLFVADLFVHGVGGAEYDEVADDVVRAFYGVEPPPYAVITATLTLPRDGQPITAQTVNALRRKLRDVEYNPQVFAGDGDALDEAARRFIAEKWELVDASADTHEARKAKWEAVREANARIAGRLGLSEGAATAEIDRARERVSADAIRFSREYSAFLIGAREVAAFYDEVLAPLEMR